MKQMKNEEWTIYEWSFAYIIVWFVTAWMFYSMNWSICMCIYVLKGLDPWLLGSPEWNLDMCICWSLFRNDKWLCQTAFAVKFPLNVFLKKIVTSRDTYTHTEKVNVTLGSWWVLVGLLFVGFLCSCNSYTFHMLTPSHHFRVFKRVSIYMLLFISTDINEWTSFCLPFAIHLSPKQNTTLVCLFFSPLLLFNDGMRKWTPFLCNLTYMLALCAYIMLN